MRRLRINGSVAVAAAITAALYLPSAAAWAQDVVIKKVDGRNIQLVDENTSTDGTEEVEIEQVEVPQQGQSWIGIKLEPLSDIVRAQLDLSDEAGVVVGYVFPDSPAAKAGIQQYDIIISSGDHPIGEGAEMVELVKKTEDGELPLTILRKNKSVELTVTPAQRPVSVPTSQGQVILPGDEGIPAIRQYRIVRPGVVLGNRLHTEHRLPEGMHLRIDREGDKPAHITIDRGDDHWELTEKELDKLPADIRAHVERSLGGVGGFAFGAPLERGRLYGRQQQREGDESDGDVPHLEDDELVWHELGNGGPLPREFNLDRAMDQIESLLKQFEQLADEQSERTEGLIDEKGEEIEKTLEERVTRLEEMLTQRADQLREMIQSFFDDDEDVKAAAESDDQSDVDKDEDSNDAEKVETETENKDEVEIEIDLDSDNTPDSAV